MKRQIKETIFVLLVCFVFTACNSDVLYDRNSKTNIKGWNMQDRQNFEVKVDELDRTSKYRFAVNISNSEDYKYNNIYFFLTTIYPDGKISKVDTIECELTNFDGSWKGKKAAGTIDNRFWFARNVEFTQKGTYVFRLQQATRDTVLTGVRSVGLHIEKMPSE